MTIKILGSGCPKCKKLEANTQQAIEEMGLDATIEKVQKIEEIMAYNVMTTPAIVVDEQVIMMGKVLSSEEIKALLSTTT